MPLKYFELLWWKQFGQIYKVRETKPQQALIRIEFRETSENKFSHPKKIFKLVHIQFFTYPFVLHFVFVLKLCHQGYFILRRAEDSCNFVPTRAIVNSRHVAQKKMLSPFSFFNQHVMSTKAKFKTSHTKKSLFQFLFYCNFFIQHNLAFNYALEPYLTPNITEIAQHWS